MPCSVVNVKHDRADVYVGRGQGSPFGNPFSTLPRPEAIREFRIYFTKRLHLDPAFLAATLALRGKRIGCWCKPLPCHADVIAEFVNAVERAEARDPVRVAPGEMPFACPVCCALMFTQLPNNHTQCPDCARWFCPTHRPNHNHACPGAKIT